MRDKKERRKNRQVMANEIATLQGALEGVQVLSEWAYEQTDANARRALPLIEAMLELIAYRMRELHRGLLDDPQ